MILRSFLFDTHARIPFSIIGVFLLLGSSVTAIYLSRLDLQKSTEIARSAEFQDIEHLLASFEADIANAMNIAGTKVLAEIGKNPVVTSTLGPPDLVNTKRIRDMLQNELQVYLACHYVSNGFSDGRYAINVICQEERLNSSIESLLLQTIPMQLQRFTIPLLGPRETVNYSTYILASVSIPIEIRILRDHSWELLTTRTVVVSCLLTSRYPLLEALMNEFHQSLHGPFSSLWSFLTVFSNLYSLVRGFKHYRCGNPLNVMDNRHLSLMINSGVYLQESLVFGSVDPLGLVSLARNTIQTLRQTPMDALQTFNTQMNKEGYMVSTENISRGSANVDAGESLNTSVDESLPMNLSEIAERVLYDITNVTLSFENEHGQTCEETICVDDDFQTSLNELIWSWAGQSFFMTHVVKQQVVNGTTKMQVEDIAKTIYQAFFSTVVQNRTVIQEQQINPGEGWIDGGVSSWNSSYFIPLQKKSLKPPKGDVLPGCALFEEWYDVLFVRSHCWYRIEEQMINGSITPVTVWQNLTDFLIEQVVLRCLLQHTTQYQGSQDDVVDVLYYNDTLADMNLQDSVDNYLARYNDSSPEKQQLLMARNNTGLIALEAAAEGSVSDWVVNETWRCLEEILSQIRCISLHPEITPSSIPNPVLFLQAARDDLLAQYDAFYADYLDYVQYHPGEFFSSVGKKAVYYAREWYAALVRNTTLQVFSGISEQLNTSLSASIPSSAGFTSGDITKTLEDVSDGIRNQFTIPFGYPMNLTRYNQQQQPVWNETVRLGVDHTPHYLDPFEQTTYDGEELWCLKIRNRCVFGPTGLPLLPPSPITPWVLTMNLWVLDVEGEYARIKLLDTSDETIFNPLLGHEPQIYVREMKIITYKNTTLGENTRLCFNFTTVAFSVVPPWGMMVGDIQESWYDDHTPGFDAG